MKKAEEAKAARPAARKQELDRPSEKKPEAKEAKPSKKSDPGKRNVKPTEKLDLKPAKKAELTDPPEEQRLASHLGRNGLPMPPPLPPGEGR